MRVILAAVISTSLIVAPAAAQYGLSPGYSAPSATHKANGKKAKATSSYAQQYGGSPYSSNPAYDVYVNGEYVGSDPDPRVRATLAAEWRSQWGLH
jgi:hypothetical protein